LAREFAIFSLLFACHYRRGHRASLFRASRRLGHWRLLLRSAGWWHAHRLLGERWRHQLENSRHPPLVGYTRGYQHLHQRDGCPCRATVIAAKGTNVAHTVRGPGPWRSAVVRTRAAWMVPRPLARQPVPVWSGSPMPRTTVSVRSFHPPCGSRFVQPLFRGTRL